MKKNARALAKKKESRDAFTLRKYAREGFLHLPKDLVTAMKGAGFKWGGDWKVHKDFMHFDMPWPTTRSPAIIRPWSRHISVCARHPQ